MPGRPAGTPAFRPAPFAVYAPPPGTLRLALLRRLLVACCLLLAAVPGVAGPSSELTLPVFYARVELEERAPVVLELGLPAADYRVEPASLGYFTGAGEFIFSAEVPRGLIYGSRNGELMVVEITAPNRAGMYIDRQLEKIRGNVAHLNEQENLLRLARQEAPDTTGGPGRLAAEFWRRLGDGAAGVMPEDWTQAVLAEYGSDLSTVDAVLTAQARHRARLKRLYYEAQAARLELMLAQYDLQLALARLPKPELEGLISLGDESLVRRTMLDEINRLRSAWEHRRSVLGHQAAGNRQWLESNSAAANATGLDMPESPLDSILAPSHYNGTGDAPDGGDDGWHQLHEIASRVQLVVAHAESAMLDQRLAELEQSARHVRQGGLPGWTDLPRYAPRLQRLRMAGLEELDAFAAVEHAARSPQTAAALLLALARAFESAGHTAAGDSGADDLAARIEPDAIAYGLLVVDRCRRGPVVTATAEEPAAEEPPADSLCSELAAMIEFPEEYGAAAYNLGFLEFVHWYAGLEHDQTERAFTVPDTPAGAADEDAGADATDSGGDPDDAEAAAASDVDTLIN